MPLIQRNNGTNNAPKIVSRGSENATDLRLSNCTDCKKGIFNFHKYTWTNRGLVHIDCSNVTMEDNSEVTFSS